MLIPIERPGDLSVGTSSVNSSKFVSGGVLTERTVGEILPALEEQVKGLADIMEKIQTAMNEKAKGRNSRVNPDLIFFLKKSLNTAKSTRSWSKEWPLLVPPLALDRANPAS